MKFIWVIFIFVSCSFYFDTYCLKIEGLQQGKIVASSNSLYYEIQVKGSTVKLEVNKFEELFISYYPYFDGKLSRFPYGCCLTPGEKDVKFYKKLGILTQSANELHKGNIPILYKEIKSLTAIFNGISDPWNYKEEEVKMLLNSQISIPSLTTKSKFEIPELDFLMLWEPENPCLTYWYPMVLSFVNNNGDKYYLNIKDDGSYVGFNRR